MKKYLFETLFAISLTGLIAFVYYLTPFAEKQMDVVVTDKYINNYSYRPYKIEICERYNILNCKIIEFESPRDWGVIQLGEMWTVKISPHDKLSEQEDKFTLSVMFSICAVFFLAIILAQTFTKEITKNVQS